MNYIVTFSDNFISTDATLLEFDVYVYIAPFYHTQFLTCRKDIGVSEFFILLIDHFKELPERISFAFRG